jgi:hypothetical protein
VTAGIKANVDGSAAIQVGGTDYITISSAGAVAIPGSLTVTGTITAGSGIPYTLNAYTSPGNYTKPAGLKLIKVTVVGGGGRGAPGNPTASGNGGGGGGTAIKVYPAPSLPASAIPYSVGAGGTAPSATGGTTSFGVAPLTVITATGGANSAPAFTGGTGSSGDINFGGGPGQGYLNIGAPINTMIGGMGGAAGGGLGAGGGGGLSAPATGSLGGQPGQNYGGGGGGAGSQSGSSTGAGGNGAPGVVIIEEFY